MKPPLEKPRTKDPVGIEVQVDAQIADKADQKVGIVHAAAVEAGEAADRVPFVVGAVGIDHDETLLAGVGMASSR
jgi:hypothetical protein